MRIKKKDTKIVSFFFIPPCYITELSILTKNFIIELRIVVGKHSNSEAKVYEKGEKVHRDFNFLQ